jgi:hypothetical protein
MIGVRPSRVAGIALQLNQSRHNLAQGIHAAETPEQIAHAVRTADQELERIARSLCTLAKEIATEARS